MNGPIVSKKLPERSPLMSDDKDLDQHVKHYYRHVENYDWTRAADAYVGFETIFHRARCRETLRLLRTLAGNGRFLDVGCGTALITRFLPGETVGVDLNLRNLQKAQRYAPKARFVLCDAEGALPLRDHSFDVAVCTEMLEHLLDPHEAIREVHRVLKPEGILVGSVPGRTPIWKLRWMSSSRHAFSEEPYHRHYSREEVKTLLSRYFHLQQLYSRYFRMNWFFVALKSKGH